MFAVVANSEEPQHLTPGKMSQRQGKDAYPTPTRELQPSLSPASLHSQGKVSSWKDRHLLCRGAFLGGFIQLLSLFILFGRFAMGLE